MSQRTVKFECPNGETTFEVLAEATNVRSILVRPSGEALATYDNDDKVNYQTLRELAFDNDIDWDSIPAFVSKETIQALRALRAPNSKIDYESVVEFVADFKPTPLTAAGAYSLFAQRLIDRDWYSNEITRFCKSITVEEAEDHAIALLRHGVQRPIVKALLSLGEDLTLIGQRVRAGYIRICISYDDPPQWAWICAQEIFSISGDAGSCWATIDTKGGGNFTAYHCQDELLRLIGEARR